MCRFDRRSAAHLAAVFAHILAVGLILLAAHSMPVREYVRVLAVEKATRAVGGSVSIGELRYNLLTLTVETLNTAWSPPASPSVDVLVRRASVAFSWRALLAGRLVPRHLLVTDVDVADLSGAGPVQMNVRGMLTLRAGGEGRVIGDFRLRGPAWVRIEGATGRLTRLDGDVAFDGSTVELQRLHVSAPGFDAEMAGLVRHLFAAPRAAMTGRWRADLPDFCTTWLLEIVGTCNVRQGTLQGHLRLDGPVSFPVLGIEARASNIVAGNGTPVVLDGEAIVSPRAIEMPRVEASIFGGMASLRDVVIIRETSRLSGATLTWRTLDVATLLESVGLDVPIASTIDGRARLTGPLKQPLALSVEAEAVLTPTRVAGVALAGGVEARFDAHGWSARVGAGYLGTTAIEGSVYARVGDDPGDALMTAAIGGSLRIESGDLREFADSLYALRLAPPRRLDFPSWDLGGTADLTLAGTLRSPRASGSLEVTAKQQTDMTAIRIRADVWLTRARIEIESLRVNRGQDRLDGSLDVGVPLSPPAGSPRARWHLSPGQAF
jgi:hypothetical protein